MTSADSDFSVDPSIIDLKEALLSLQRCLLTPQTLDEKSKESENKIDHQLNSTLETSKNTQSSKFQQKLSKGLEFSFTFDKEWWNIQKIIQSFQAQQKTENTNSSFDKYELSNQLQDTVNNIEIQIKEFKQWQKEIATEFGENSHDSGNTINRKPLLILIDDNSDILEKMKQFVTTKNDIVNLLKKCSTEELLLNEDISKYFEELKQCFSVIQQYVSSTIRKFNKEMQSSSTFETVSWERYPQTTSILNEALIEILAKVDMQNKSEKQLQHIDRYPKDQNKLIRDPTSPPSLGLLSSSLTETASSSTLNSIDETAPLGVRSQGRWGDGSRTAFPSLSNCDLERLHLLPSDEGTQPPDLTQTEINTRFEFLSLAFRIDEETIKRRLIIHTRERFNAERNIAAEIELHRKQIEKIRNSCSIPSDMIGELRKSSDIILQCSMMVAQKSELLGAIEQENRISQTMKFFLSYIENLQIQHANDIKKLEEASGHVHSHDHRTSISSDDTRFSSSELLQLKEARRRFQTAIQTTTLQTQVTGAFKSAVRKKMKLIADEKEHKHDQCDLQVDDIEEKNEEPGIVDQINLKAYEYSSKMDRNKAALLLVVTGTLILLAVLIPAVYKFWSDY